MLNRMLLLVLAGCYALLCACVGEPLQDAQLAVTQQKPARIPFTGYMQDCQEAGQYGLYTYLAMAYPGNSQNFIEIIRSVIEKSSRLHREMDTSAEPGLLNNVFIPLWLEAPDWVAKVDLENRDELDAAARWVAQNYDHKCARLLMSSIPSPGRNDIYILSSLSQLSTDGKSAILLAQRVNDTGKPRLTLVDEFFKKTWHQRQWTEAVVKSLAYNLTLFLQGAKTIDEFSIPVSDYLREEEVTDAAVETEAPSAEVAQELPELKDKQPPSAASEQSSEVISIIRSQ